MSRKTGVVVFVGGVALSPSSSLRTLILEQVRDLSARGLPHRASVTDVRGLPSDLPLREEDSGQCGQGDDA